MSENTDSPTWDTIIVGGGFAGLSAAYMLGRARRRVLVIDSGLPRNRFAAHMHGVLGHDGYSPVQLLADGRQELAKYGVEFRTGSAVGAERAADGFTVTTDSDTTETTRRLLVTTGIRDELPPIDGLVEQWGRGVVMCPYCDGWEVRDRRIGVIATGGGPHQVLMLRQWSARVTYFTRGEFAPTADERRTMAARGIRVDERPIARAVSTDDVLTAIEIAGGELVPVDSIFTGPTLVAHDDLLATLGAERAESRFGSFVSVNEMFATTVPGVWAAGNVVNPGAAVPIAMGAGTTAGAAINADLTLDDNDRALAALEGVDA